MNRRSFFKFLPLAPTVTAPTVQVEGKISLEEWKAFQDWKRQKQLEESYPIREWKIDNWLAEPYKGRDFAPSIKEHATIDESK